MKFHVSSRKSEILYFDGFLLSKSYKIDLKKHRRNYSNDTEEWCKVKEKLTCSFKYGMGNFVNFHTTTQKSENFFSMDSFCPAIQGLSYNNIEELSFMTLSSDVKSE